ncbi:hypothetical protein BNATCHR1118 (nucleomorph) [Bigelowiella natans]|uniref:Uncharacterized protein n=1 Tax=Bigelowiella natans TaxID=227086 RepID=Q3LWC6_BIGNA|nr:hypothetical protein BNATCHR1118 [Bigelowiella natans]ABA27239.1 hypothetical protein [Bigelowiella natans]
MYHIYAINYFGNKYGHSTSKSLMTCYIGIFLAFIRSYVCQNLIIEKEKKFIFLNSLLSLLNCISLREYYKNKKILYIVKRLYFLTTIQLIIFRVKYYYIFKNELKIKHNQYHQFLINHRKLYASFFNVILIVKTFLMFIFLFYLKIYKYSTNLINSSFNN